MKPFSGINFIRSFIVAGCAANLFSMAGCSNAQHQPINYLDQKPPGLSAELFAPNIISTDSFEHSAPAFSPDGTTVLWTVVNSSYHGYLLEMKFENGRWSAPMRPSFADSTADDYYPSFSPDGKKLYFSSRRALPAGYPPVGDMRIWEVERTPNCWGHPLPIDTNITQGNEYAHSIAANGTLYFTSSTGGNTKWNIKNAARKNSNYAAAEVLPFNINSTDYEDGPYISPTEEFLIFETIRPESLDGNLDLFITFKDKNGQWGIPINMGPKINSVGAERFARLSPDGKYLFFGSNRNMSDTRRGFDVYWIDATVIDELRQQQKDVKKIDAKFGIELIQSLYTRGNLQSVPLLKQWLEANPNNLDAVIAYSSMLRKMKNFDELDRLLNQNASLWNKNESFIMEMALLKYGTNRQAEAIKLLEPVLKQSDRLRDKYIYLSDALFDMELYAPSNDYFAKGMTINPWHRGYFQRGCAYARIGDKDKAFENLRQAAALGFTFKGEFETNPDLQLLKTDQRWPKLMQKLQ